MKNLILLAVLLIAQLAHAADSLYVCRNGIYECRLLVGAHIDLSADADADSIIFTRPAPIVRIDLSALPSTVSAIYIRSNNDQKLATNTAMKNYSASSSTVSDVMRIAVGPDQQSIDIPLSITTNLAKGITLTAQLDGAQFVTISSDTPIRRIDNHYVHCYAFPATSQRSNNWMGTLPSRVRLSSITMPGTHDAATSKVSTDMSRCQSLTIGQQLRAGVRALDLRPRYKANKEADITLENLEIYHGITATSVKWKDALDTISVFLAQNPTETVFINMQKEASSGTDYSAAWRTAIRTSLQQHSSHVLQQLTANTTLGDCRGKMVVVSHNPYGSEGVYNDVVYGALAASWDDNATFSTKLNYTNNTAICDATISDNYNATKEADKQAFITANLDAASKDNTTRWFMTFTNVAWTFLGNNPDAHAKKHNANIATLISNGTYASRLGIVFSDFLGDTSCSGDKLLQSVIMQNYRYLY